MTITELTTPKLKNPLPITQHHLRIFEELYTYLRLDFPTLQHLLADVPWQERTLRLRLYELQKANCVHVFYGGFGKPPVFALLDRGLAILLTERNEPIRRTTAPAHDDAERIRKHDVGLSKYIVARNAWGASQGSSALLSHQDIFNQSHHEKVKREHRWPVSYHYSGQFHHHYIKPDYVGHFPTPSRPERFAVTEFDASTETKRPKRYSGRKYCPHSKLVAYVATIEHQALDKFCGIRDFEVEFVCISDQRRDGLIDLALQEVHDPKTAKRIVFATQPPCPTEAPDAFAFMQWFDATGQPVERGR